MKKAINCGFGLTKFHDQNSLSPNARYLLKDKSLLPEGAKPFFVQSAYPSDSSIRFTNEPEKARVYRGVYLLNTAWQWELGFTAIPV